MQKPSIIIAPDPRLKQRAKAIDRVDDKARQLMDGMLDAMRAANGVGLAAPQVGVLKRIIVVDTATRDEDPRPYRMANPEIVWVSDDAVCREEGCLSLPDQYADVTRPERIRVRYLDAENEIRELEADGLLARCIQHEMDHLEGTLFVDHLSSLKRGIILRKLTKTKRMATAPA